ncbi:MAG: transglutaminase-like domain-containing protein [Chthoniobacteraceae bacterium]|jgi:regulator of sirC expression with transglutaminase-like and TPR domain
MFAQKDAIVKLLQDDDPRTVDLVKDQLAQQGSAALPSLQDLLTMYDERVTEHVKDVMGRIDSEEAGQELGRMCRNFGENGDLEAFCWLLARALIPGTEVDEWRALLDQWASRVEHYRASEDTAEDRVRLLAHFLGGQLGFRGNTEDYYNPDNTLLPRVMTTRLGIPITLTVLYMFIGERCGLPVEGINFPGHFLARHDGVLFDPFERGRIIGITECKQILARQKLELQPDHLETAASLAIARRILANLLYVYQSDEEAEAAGRVTAWLHALDR